MSADIYVSMFDGKFDIGFDCSEGNQHKCKFCMTESPGEGRCTFWRDGSCHQLGSRVEAITKMVAKLNKSRREIEEEMEG